MVLENLFFYSFGLSSSAGQKIFQETRIKLFKMINKHVLSYIAFYLEDDDHKTVDFINQTKGLLAN